MLEASSSKYISRRIQEIKESYFKRAEGEETGHRTRGVYRVHAAEASHNEYVSNLWRAVVWYHAVLRPLTLACMLA